MKSVENERFLINENTDGSLVIYEKKHTGDVRLYVEQNEVDGLIKLLEAAKTESIPSVVATVTKRDGYYGQFDNVRYALSGDMDRIDLRLSIEGLDAFAPIEDVSSVAIRDNKGLRHIIEF